MKNLCGYDISITIWLNLLYFILINLPTLEQIYKVIEFKGNSEICSELKSNTTYVL